jgi:predicted DNA-binding transcriptional regulator AlpA
MEVKDIKKEGYIIQPEAAKFLGIKISTIKKWRKTYEDFPKPIKVSDTAIFFKKKELEEWMEKRRMNE